MSDEYKKRRRAGNDYPDEKSTEELRNDSIAKEKEDRTKGKLYIVSTSIGNKNDITLRAVDVLTVCDYVLCEEMKIGAQILRNYNVSKDLEQLNEHNEFEAIHEVIRSIKQDNKRVAMISDCGTPVMNDPGLLLVRAALANDVNIEVVPGATSVMTGIVRSGFAADKFVCAGFLNRDPLKRQEEIKDLSHEDKTVVILDTPYRLKIMLEACAKEMPDRYAYLGCALTTHFESNHYGTFSELVEKFKDLNFKSEFILCFEGLDPQYVKARGFNQRKQNRDFSNRDSSKRGFPKRDSRDFPKRDYSRGDSDRGFRAERDGGRDGGRDFKRRDDRSGGGNRNDRSPGDGRDRDFRRSDDTRRPDSRYDRDSGRTDNNASQRDKDW